MEDARLGSIQMIGTLQVMLEVVGQFELYYSEQTQGILRSLVATLSLLVQRCLTCQQVKAEH